MNSNSNRAQPIALELAVEGDWSNSDKATDNELCSNSTMTTTVLRSVRHMPGIDRDLAKETAAIMSSINAVVGFI